VEIHKETLLASLPAEWPEDLLPQIQDRVARSGAKIIVLDDDPTGTQTVHDVTVLTESSVPGLVSAFAEPEAAVYVLTNSRSMPLADAQALNRCIVADVKQASSATGRGFVLVSRSDSTLRGHYPGEIEAIVDELGQDYDATLLVPFFLEGGRFTAGNVHYVAEGEWLVPAAETTYARDPAFGYSHSDLCTWVCEKTGGCTAADQVASISLETIRQGGPDSVTEELLQLTGGRVCVVNAVSYRDLEVFVLGLLRAEAAGKRFIYRTAASFVRVRAGIAPRGLLASRELVAEERAGGGLIIVGSFVDKTTRQVGRARERFEDLHLIEVSVPDLLASDTGDAEVARAVAVAEQVLARGDDAMICTSRELVQGVDGQASLEIGQTVSEALVTIVRRLSTRPSWVIAKGGITSSNIATEALGVARARVLGQAVPGVPIWRLGAGSRWPRLVYVVFPGNVGGDDAVADMIGILRSEQPG